jgi:hypothetical protein
MYLVGEHGSVDDVAVTLFEDAQGFHAAVAVVIASVEQSTSWRVKPCLSPCDAVRQRNHPRRRAGGGMPAR